MSVMSLSIRDRHDRDAGAPGHQPHVDRARPPLGAEDVDVAPRRRPPGAGLVPLAAGDDAAAAGLGPVRARGQRRHQLFRRPADDHAQRAVLHGVPLPRRLLRSAARHHRILRQHRPDDLQGKRRPFSSFFFLWLLRLGLGLGFCVCVCVWIYC